jgi:amino acid permease
MPLEWLIQLWGKLNWNLKRISACRSKRANIKYSFATGWNYFFKYIIAAPTNLTAAGLVIEYWRPDLSVAIWIAVFGVIVVTVNVSKHSGF